MKALYRWLGVSLLYGVVQDPNLSKNSNKKKDKKKTENSMSPTNSIFRLFATLCQIIILRGWHVMLQKNSQNCKHVKNDVVLFYSFFLFFSFFLEYIFKIFELLCFSFLFPFFFFFFWGKLLCYIPMIHIFDNAYQLFSTVACYKLK